jgi:hypothetical protein
MAVSVSNQTGSIPGSRDLGLLSTSTELNHRIDSLIRAGSAFMLEPTVLSKDVLERVKSIREKVCLPADWEGSEELLKQDRSR